VIGLGGNHHGDGGGIWLLDPGPYGGLPYPSHSFWSQMGPPSRQLDLWVSWEGWRVLDGFFFIVTMLSTATVRLTTQYPGGSSGQFLHVSLAMVFALGLGTAHS
jgi:hypothetical protein